MTCPRPPSRSMTVPGKYGSAGLLAVEERGGQYTRGPLVYRREKVTNGILHNLYSSLCTWAHYPASYGGGNRFQLKPL